MYIICICMCIYIYIQRVGAPPTAAERGILLAVVIAIVIAVAMAVAIAFVIAIIIARQSRKRGGPLGADASRFLSGNRAAICESSILHTKVLRVRFPGELPVFGGISPHRK